MTLREQIKALSMRAAAYRMAAQKVEKKIERLKDACAHEENGTPTYVETGLRDVLKCTICGRVKK